MSTKESANPIPSGRCQPGAIRLSTYLQKLFGVGNCGCYNPFSRLSSGRPSWHVHGEAIDLCCNWYNAGARQKGDRCFDWVIAHREELNLQQCIWGDRIYNIGSGVSRYRHSDHKNHIHISLGHNAAKNWTPTGVIPGGYEEEKPKMEDDDDMKMFVHGSGAKTVAGKPGTPGPGAFWYITDFQTKRQIFSEEERDFLWKAGATKGDREVHMIPQQFLDTMPLDK